LTEHWNEEKGKPMVEHYNLKNIRTMLTEGFTDEELCVSVTMSLTLDSFITN
jgi:hypothetical protein